LQEEGRKKKEGFLSPPLRRETLIRMWRGFCDSFQMQRNREKEGGGEREKKKKKERGETFMPRPAAA